MPGLIVCTRFQSSGALLCASAIALSLLFTQHGLQASPAPSSSQPTPPSPYSALAPHLRELADDLSLANVALSNPRTAATPRGNLPCAYEYEFVAETQNALLRNADRTSLIVSNLDQQHVAVDFTRRESFLDNGAPAGPFFDDSEFRPGELSSSGANRSRISIHPKGLSEDSAESPILFPNKSANRACPGIAFLPAASGTDSAQDWLSQFIRPGNGTDRNPEHVGSGRFRIVARATSSALPVILIDAELQLQGEYRFPSGPARAAYIIEESTGWPLAARIIRNDANNSSRAVFNLRKTGNCGPQATSVWARPKLYSIMAIARRFIYFWGQLRASDAIALFDQTSLTNGASAATSALLTYAGKTKQTSFATMGDLNIRLEGADYIVQLSGLKENTSAQLVIRGDKIQKVTIEDTEKRSTVFRLGR